ncbi:hypothetical protein LX15_006375 [Streptoalloteichus tenebrarius]|uniref:Secreted protein n=1 Tax=Streptoalloteichus tenebrarius (strain ATCC 17920 / DSM 40477 / JCM 4838 / CBS 697.72 / NBRC 16177 / NCIMB 11028 / NRRL B-12390 / A12253. 1 / ISP 5477) TaxID=1933 RepID=A0ABT1I4A0_STRSD|nr:hypothetical protein [Streptoalloteichus tenebrarius]MCP2262633.1 hypothetical protein [Streptoalloteichus tenebrarius]BFF02454.1 hypothetical protein GCM10020241_41290 [Streptoalloteichus tenebrarius]
MLYLLAMIGAVTVGILMWRAFGPSTLPTRAPRRAPVAPDDDPEFLRKLDERVRRQDDDQ